MRSAIEKGYVYVLTNDCLKEVDCVFKGERMKVPAVKIGKARTLENRIGTLNTGTYRNFKCHLQVKTDDVKMLEAIIGIALDDYRITEQGRTEFFALPLKEVIRRVKKIAQSLRLEVKYEKKELVGRSAAAMRSTQRRQRRADASSPDVMWTNKSQKAHKTVFTRKVTTVAPKSNFTVRFPDGVTIADEKAYWVLAKSIEKLGAADVAKLGVMVGGEPLVTQDKALLKKHPNAIAAIKGGWFVKTHSGTAAKMRYVKTIAKALKVTVVVAGA